MVSRAGILPFPKSPTIKNGVPASYIKQSYFPIPYQAIIAIESCNISDVLSWDINVSTKSIKVRIEWSMSNDNSSNEMFPKAIYNSISSYHLVHPTWSSSCSNNKLNLKVEWKIKDPNTTDPQQFSPSPSQTVLSQTNYYPSPIAPSFHTPGYIPYSNNSDSGYGSPNFPRSRLPASRLDFSSPTKISGRHDIYRSSPIKSHHQTSPIHESKVDTDSSNSKRLPKPVIPIPPSPPLPSSSTSTDPPKSRSPHIPITPPSSSTNPPNSEPPHSPPIPPPHPPKSNILHDANPKSIPNSSGNPSSANTKSEPAAEACVNESATPPKYVILENSKDGDICATLNPKCVPWDDIFVDIPADIIIDDNGLIEEKFASLMDIQGSCRRCKKAVSSYESDDHLLYCPKIPREDFDSFCIDQAKIYNTTDCDIEAVAAGYCQREIDLSDINNVFPKASQFESFIHDLELFLDNFASKVYSSLNISGQRKRFNILNYK
jgi:hypothetical protein